MHERGEHLLPAVLRFVRRLCGVDLDSSLLPRHLRRDLHQAVLGRQRLRSPGLLQVARPAAALGAATVQRASQVHGYPEGDDVRRLPVADRIVRLRRVQRKLRAGHLLRIPHVLELQLLPDDLLWKFDLRILQGLHPRNRKLHGHALLRELLIVSLVLLRHHELPAVLPGVQRRQLLGHLDVRQLRRVRRGLRHLQQHRVQRLHAGDDQLLRYPS